MYYCIIQYIEILKVNEFTDIYIWLFAHAELKILVPIFFRNSNTIKLKEVQDVILQEQLLNNKKNFFIISLKNVPFYLKSNVT